MSIAAAVKSLQSCLTLCNPIDSSPPGSPVPGILQARTLEWVAISFSNAWKWKVKVKSLCCAWLLATLWTAAYQAPSSMGFSRQEYWSGVPLPSPILKISCNNSFYVLSSVQSLSRVWLFGTPWTTAHQASLSITNSQSLPKLMSIESVMPSSHLILCRPLLLLPPIPSSIRVFSNESTLRMRWPKYWRFSFSISPFNEHPGLISFRMDWLDLLAVQGTLKSLLQHHSSKASILRRSAFFIVQLSHPWELDYMTTGFSNMTTGKTTALTRWTFVDKVMSMLFNMLSRLVITFLPRSKGIGEGKERGRG